MLLQVPQEGPEKVDDPHSCLEPSCSVYALGDCCAHTVTPLPPLAQVFSCTKNFCHQNKVFYQQGRFLSHPFRMRSTPCVNTAKVIYCLVVVFNKCLQVAEQQGKYLAATLNAIAKHGTSPKPFQYKHMGAMATLGDTTAVLELQKPSRVFLRGFTSWVAWRSAYMTRLGSWRNRLYVAFNWTLTLILGRDLSRW